jgi:lysophospholipase L1-like esterase
VEQRQLKFQNQFMKTFNQLRYGCAIGSVSLMALAPAAEVAGLQFAFGAGQPQAGYTLATPQTTYDAQRGFGFLKSAAASPNAPRVFAVDVGEGNFDVTIRFGDPARATATTIKAESRRLMLHQVETAPGQFETRTFTVNVRKPTIRTGGVTALNSREKGPPVTPDWDELLTFEFNGKNPGVAALEIKPVPDTLTLFIAGDSTVTDQAREPYAGWGQMLPRFFRDGIGLSNQAESGLALRSFEQQKRLEKILSMMKKGDYLFIQFGHNDQKDKTAGAGPFTTYKKNLKWFVAVVRSKGGIPVLITPMERRRFEKDGKQAATLAEYAEAVRQVGAEELVPVIDLNAMSLKLYAALGPENSKKAFVHYPANTFPGQTKVLEDNTHHNAFGGYELARCVVEGIRANVPELAKYLVKDAGTFDPTQPDTPEAVGIPASALMGAPEKPAGN